MELRIDYSETGRRKEGRKKNPFWGNLPNTNRVGMSQNEVWQAVQELIRTVPSLTTTNMPMVNINFTGVCITSASYVSSDNSILEHCFAICTHKNPLVSY